MEQIKTLVRAFNALVADQIAHGDDGRVRPDLLEEFKRHSRFDVVTAKTRIATRCHHREALP